MLKRRTAAAQEAKMGESFITLSTCCSIVYRHHFNAFSPWKLTAWTRMRVCSLRPVLESIPTPSGRKVTKTRLLSWPLGIKESYNRGTGPHGVRFGSHYCSHSAYRNCSQISIKISTKRTVFYLCEGPITHPEQSYQVWCVWGGSWSLDNKEAFTHWGLLRHGGKKC